jgi:hypothetical protein
LVRPGGCSVRAEQLPAESADGSLQNVEQSAAVVVMNDVLAGIAARHDVVDGAYKFDAETSRHWGKDSCGRGVGSKAETSECTVATGGSTKNQKQRLTPRAVVLADRRSYG